MAEETSLTKNTEDNEITTNIANDPNLASNGAENNEALFGVSDDAADEEATDETEQIREQIEETRSKMSETIDAIQEKLSLSNISEQVTEQVTEQVSNIYQTAKETVYEATLGKAGTLMQKLDKEINKSGFMRELGDRPLPLFLIALGAGLLLFNNNKKSSRTNYRYAGGGRSLKSSNYENRNRSSMLKSASDSISSAAGSTYETVGNAANSAYETVGGAANTAYEKVTGLADTTWQKAGDLGGQVREQYDYYIEENPLAVGAVALAVGAAVGFAIPSTRYESELVGEARENLMSRVGETVSETIDKVKTVADQAKNTVTEEAKNQGLVQ